MKERAVLFPLKRPAAGGMPDGKNSAALRSHCPHPVNGIIWIIKWVLVKDQAGWNRGKTLVPGREEGFLFQCTIENVQLTISIWAIIL